MALAAVIIAGVASLPATSGASPSHVSEQMPDVVGLNRAEVNALMSRDLLYFATSGPGSSTETWNRVVSQIPAAGTIVQTYSTVRFVVTIVAASTTVTVPNVVGMGPSAVIAAMKRAQLYYSTSGPGAGTTSWRRVVSENPAAGTQVAARSTVALDVTTAAVKVPVKKKPVTPGVVLPRLVGLSRARALNDLKRDQLRLSVKRVGSPQGAWDEIIAQSPAAGTRVSAHHAVTITVERRVTTPTTTTTYPGETTTTLSAAQRARARALAREKAKALALARAKARAKALAEAKARAAAAAAKAKYIRDHSKVGIATWYNYIPGRCATWYLPKGVRLHIEDLATHKVITCLVTDREGARGDHCVDLSETQFAELASPSTGVIRVRVWW